MAGSAYDSTTPNGETKRYEAGSFALNQYVSIDYAGALVPAPAHSSRRPRTRPGARALVPAPAH